MDTTDNRQSSSLFSGQDSHQKEEMDQADQASKAAYTLEPEKGMSPAQDGFSRGGKQGNIKQVVYDVSAESAGMIYHAVNDVDPEEDESNVTRNDLKTLDGEGDEESTM